MSPRKAASSGETATCPWCSATVPVEAATCPSCGAQLRDAADGDVLGVTQIDPSVAMKSKRIKSRALASWLTGDTTSSDSDSDAKVEPPSEEVRKEMLRLELAAIDAEIEAKRAAAEAQKALPPDDDLAKPG
jgi:hypothetical protein